jgi:hypothetical protein
MSATPESLADALQRDVETNRTGGLASALAQTQDIGAAFFGQSEFERETGLPFVTRMKVSAADNDAERNRAFFQDFPQGVMHVVPVTHELVFKFDAQDETEPFKTVERSVPAELTLDSVTREALEFGKDVADVMVNTVGPIGGEILAAVATRGRSLLARLAALSGGALAGEFAQEGVEAMAGISDEPLRGTGVRGGTSAIMAPVGFGAGAGVGRVVQGVSGRGFLSTAPEAREAMRAIDDINRMLERTGSDVRVPQLSTGQAAEAPIFRRLEEQSAALTAPVRRQRQEQVDAVQKVLDTAVDQRSIETGRRAVEAAYDAERNRLMATISDPKVVLSQGGRAIEDGITRYDNAARIQVDTLYEIARKIEDPVFDMGNAVENTGLLGAAIKELRGVPVAAREFSEEEIEVLTARGVPVTAFRRDTVQAAPVDPEIERLAAEMLTASPEAVSTEALRAWRSRLWDLKQTPTGDLPGQRQFQAQRLFTAVNKTLDNPVNSNPRFVHAWKVANARASNRFDTLEKSVVARILRSGDLQSGETVEQLARSFQSPFNASNLRFIKSVVPNETYEQFRNSFKTRLLSQPGNIIETIDNFDQETIGLLLSPSERTAFRNLGESLSLLDSVGVQQQLRAQTAPREFLRGLIDRGDTSGISQLKKLVNSAGGIRSPAGKSIRFALLDVAFDKFIVETEVSQLSSQAVGTFIKDLRRLGLSAFLTDSDRHLVRNMATIAPYFRFSRGGAGASIQAAEAASGVIEGSPAAIWELIEKAGAGRALVNSRVRGFLLGRPGSDPIDDELIKILGAATLTAVSQTAETAPSVELINLGIQ